MIDVVVPKLTDAGTEVEIVRWHKKEGDTVSKGELLCEVETEKAVEEIYAPISGKLVSLKPEGSLMKIHEVIARIVEKA